MFIEIVQTKSIESVNTMITDNNIINKMVNNPKSLHLYTQKLINEGWDNHYVTLYNNEFVRYKYMSEFWLGAITYLENEFLNGRLSYAPSNVMVYNRKWYIPITILKSCGLCSKPLSDDCNCVLELKRIHDLNSSNLIEHQP